MPHSPTCLDRGQQIARLLGGAWRSDPPPLDRNGVDLESILPQLEITGASGLAWWKLRKHLASDDPLLGQLERATHVQRCENFLREFQLQHMLALLRECQIEPILAKGWSIARLYPHPGVRPFGDFDLHVEPEQLAAAAKAMADAPEWVSLIDLHEGLPDLEDRSFAEVFRRSQSMPLRETHVRVLPDADHLRLLCLHFVRHGGWRPLWLCDIGAFVESLPATFDWDDVWQGDPGLTAWVRAGLAVAIRLLGIRVSGKGTAELCQEARWLDDVVLAEWGTECAGDSHSRDSVSMSDRILRPWGIMNGLRMRIPNPLEAAFKMRASPSRVQSGFWQQVRYCWRRARGFALRLRPCRKPLTQSSPNRFEIHWTED